MKKRFHSPVITLIKYIFVSRYDNTNGVFTVPPGGDVNLVGETGEIGRFDMTLNDDIICSTIYDHSNNGASDWAPGSCNAIVDVVAGTYFTVVYSI